MRKCIPKAFAGLFPARINVKIRQTCIPMMFDPSNVFKSIVSFTHTLTFEKGIITGMRFDPLDKALRSMRVYNRELCDKELAKITSEIAEKYEELIIGPGEYRSSLWRRLVQWIDKAFTKLLRK